MHRFHGVCNIPYGTKGQLKYDSLVGHSELKMPESGFDLYEDIRQNGLKEHRPRQYAGEFKEEFELDLNFDIYEKIEIPDFKDGRRGRFIHDFNANKTGIIDLDGNRCFVMPLNRYQVLPPRSLFDLIKKMWEGYYEVDTEVVRETMRVITPPLSDMQGVGQYISRECMGMPTYKLQKVSRPIFKRSVTEDLPDNAKFAEFAGRNVVEFDIINFEELLSFEAGQTKRSDVVAPVVEGDSSTKAGQSQDEEVGKNRGE
ncbi:hypothetical protein J437_LFUL009293 [Ladona fulva]|uniref:Integral membrane protein 2 n=1 Tax=Ladona fulva TaxID=123851 RepID=A0A8K0P0Y0_LADFU|nr:hypothetical protein J437_LFUL009293 [Ladona fulva]